MQLTAESVEYHAHGAVTPGAPVPVPVAPGQPQWQHGAAAGCRRRHQPPQGGQPPAQPGQPPQQPGGQQWGAQWRNPGSGKGR